MPKRFWEGFVYELSEFKLEKVLPNLPQDCEFVVIASKLNNTCKMVSTKLKRANIECALFLLKKTGLPPWKDIDIFESKLEV